MLGSIVSLGNGKYRLFVSNKFDGQGKHVRYSKTITATSQRDAERQLGVFYRQMTSMATPDCNKITFEKFAAEWRNRFGNKLTPGTLSAYESALETRLIPYFGLMYLNKIQPEQIQIYFNDLNNNPERLDALKDRPLSKGSIYNLFKILRAILGKAVDWGFIKQNPCQLIPKQLRPKKIYKKRDILQLSDLKQFLAALDRLEDKPINVKYKLAFRIMFLCGLRRGELYALKFKDFNSKENSILVDESSFEIKGKRGTKETKNYKTRVIYADARVFKLLEKHRNYQIKWLEEHNCKNPDDYVFIQKFTDKGKALRAGGSGIYHWLQKFLKKSGLPAVCVHAIRHMAASYSLANNVDLTTVQRMMGHANISTTSIYLHSIDELNKASADKMGQIFDEMASSTKNKQS